MSFEFRGNHICHFFFLGGIRVWTSSLLLILDLKRKIRGISIRRLVVPCLKIFINPPRTYEKLHCKEEPYWFSGQRDPLLQTDRQTHTQILLHLCKHYISYLKYSKPFIFLTVKDKALHSEQLKRLISQTISLTMHLYIYIILLC